MTLTNEIEHFFKQILRVVLDHQILQVYQYVQALPAFLARLQCLQFQVCQVVLSDLVVLDFQDSLWDLEHP